MPTRKQMIDEILTYQCPFCINCIQSREEMHQHIHELHEDKIEGGYYKMLLFKHGIIKTSYHIRIDTTKSIVKALDDIDDPNLRNIAILMFNAELKRMERRSSYDHTKSQIPSLIKSIGAVSRKISHDRRKSH